MRAEPSIQEQIEFFDRRDEQHRNVGFEQVEPESKARADKVLELLGTLPPEHPRLLHVGCGTGRMTERLARFGPTTAIDLSPHAIEIARKRGLDAEFIAGDFFAQEFPHGRFDLGVCMETISVITEQARFVARLAETIRPGGHLILTTQNKFVYERRSDIGPPTPGNVPRWLGAGDLSMLLRPAFHIVRLTSVLPKGDRGVLRIAHSQRLNRLLGLAFSRETIVRAQEALGLGHTLVVLAQRRGT